MYNCREHLSKKTKTKPRYLFRDPCKDMSEKEGVWSPYVHLYIYIYIYIYIHYYFFYLHIAGLYAQITCNYGYVVDLFDNN